MVDIALVGDCCSQDVPAARIQRAMELVRDCDVFVMNLEGPVTDWPAPRLQVPDRLRRYISAAVGKKQPLVRTMPEELEYFKPCPVNVAMLANNHILDFGSGAVGETLRHLDAHGITALGAGPNLRQALCTRTIEVGGYSIGLASYSAIGLEFPPGAPLILQHAKREIAALRERCDLVVVGLHLGRVGMDEMRVGDTRRVQALLEAGADVVAVHHAHRAHPPFVHAGGVSVGLGDFLFQEKEYNQPPPSAVLRVRLDDDSVHAKVVWVEDITAEKIRSSVIMNSELRT